MYMIFQGLCKSTLSLPTTLPRCSRHHRSTHILGHYGRPLRPEDDVRRLPHFALAIVRRSRANADERLLAAHGAALRASGGFG